MPTRAILSAPQPIRPNSSLRASLAGLAAALLVAQADPARSESCRLALVLAIDVSGSVSIADDQLQRGGLAAALLATPVVSAFLDGGPVALYAFEWAGASSQTALLGGWVMIQNETDLLHVAGTIAPSRQSGLDARQRGDGTAVGSALLHAAAALDAGPDCAARTVDVSGDGVNSQGIAPSVVLEALYDGITVNALVIHETIQDPMLDRSLGGATPLVTWFNDTVLHGPGAFAIVADGYGDYEQAMTAKLLRELSLPMVSQVVPAAGNLGQAEVRGM